MRKCIPVLLFSILLFNRIAAQNGWDRATSVLAPPVVKGTWTSPATKIPLEEIEPFLSFFIVWEGEGEVFQVRFSEDGDHWSAWSKVERDSHNPEKRITQPLFAEAGYRYFQVRYSDMEVSNLTCHFFSPGATPPRIPHPPVNPGWRDEMCPSPPVVERSEWCPNGGCPGQSTPSTTKVSHLIVHHSAGTNIANDWAAIVRAIWDLHVNGNGWADIGYNYLIDPDGTVYTGRGNDVLGAHFCARNSNTMGVCVLGNFQESSPKETALKSLVELLTWKSHQRNLNPAGSALHPSSGITLFNISGHRDGCATACPGNQLYPLLTDLRFRVANSLAICQGLSTAVSSPANNTLSNALSLTPNPVDHVLELHLDTPLKGDVLVEVFGIDGRPLHSRLQEKDHRSFIFPLPLSKLPAGYYWVRLRMAGRSAVAPFVKQ